MAKEGARETLKTYICGWCLGAASTGRPTRTHRRCSSTICECGTRQHRFDTELAKRMAVFCHIELDEVFEAHGRKRRVLTEEQRVAAAENLKKARAARGTDKPLALTPEDEEAVAELLGR